MNQVVYLSQAELAEMLRERATAGKHYLPTFSHFAEARGLPEGLGRILEDHEIDNKVFEVHLDWWDVWVGVEGEIEFIVGGELVNPKPRVKDGSPDSREPRSEEVRGETKTYTLHAGEWLWIPPGVPHRHRAIGTGRAFVLKAPK